MGVINVKIEDLPQIKAELKHVIIQVGGESTSIPNAEGVSF